MSATAAIKENIVIISIGVMVAINLNICGRNRAETEDFLKSCGGRAGG
jgi:hypothetical protein